MSIGQGPLGSRAVAALEFAIALPTLLILLGGIVDFGQAMYCRNALANAIAAGAQYAVMNAGTATSTTIQSMVQYVSGLTGITVKVTGPAGYCITGYPPAMTSATAGSTCSDGSTAGTYAIINASYTYSGLMGSYSVPNLFSMSDSATVRLQ
jgi:Flp pilus assembly protein TadG